MTTAEKMMKAMENCRDNFELRRLADAAEMLYLADVISREEEMELHEFWMTHWYNERTQQLEILD